MRHLGLIFAVFFLAAFGLSTAPSQELPPRAKEGRDRPTLTKNAWEIKGKLYRPWEVVASAAEDITVLSATWPAEKLKYVRYLTVYNYPASMRDDVAGLTSFTVNSLSRKLDIIRPAVGGPDNIVIRVNLRDYGINPSDWDEMCLVSPYFHQDIDEKELRTTVTEKPLDPAVVDLEIKVTGQSAVSSRAGPATIRVALPEKADLLIDNILTKSTGPNRVLTTKDLAAGVEYKYTLKVLYGGKTTEAPIYIAAGRTTWVEVAPKIKERIGVFSETEETGKVQRKRAAASWTVSPTEFELLQANKLKSEDTAMGRLIALTQSKAPIARADWFIVNAWLAPNYYKLLRIQTLEDFENLVFFDPRLAQFEIQATVVKSGSYGLATPVARQNRLMGRVKHATGYWWESYDYLASVGVKNVINNFLNLGNRKAADAQEFIATGINGLQYYALTAKVSGNKLINAGDINLVTDENFPDRQVICGRSCVVCHAKGIQPFRSHHQLNIKDLTSYIVFDKDPKKAQEQQERVDQVFGRPNWDEAIDADQAFYRKVVIAACGREPEVNAQVLSLVWNGYKETDLDLARIVYEVGLTHEEIKALIAVKKNGLNNGVLLQQLATPPIVIRRDQWEEVYAEIMTISTITKK